MQEQKTSLKQWKEQNKDIKISIKKWASQKWLVSFCSIMQGHSKHYLYLENRENETKKFRHDIRNHLNCITDLIDKGNYETTKTDKNYHGYGLLNVQTSNSSINFYRMCIYSTTFAFDIYFFNENIYYMYDSS